METSPARCGLEGLARAVRLQALQAPPGSTRLHESASRRSRSRTHSVCFDTEEFVAPSAAARSAGVSPAARLPQPSPFLLQSPPLPLPHPTPPQSPVRVAWRVNAPLLARAALHHGTASAGPCSCSSLDSAGPHSGIKQQTRYPHPPPFPTTYHFLMPQAQVVSDLPQLLRKGSHGQ